MTGGHHLIVVAALFVLGAAVGSFLNVCVYRIPAGRSVLRPRSRCPRCGTAIAARDNIPVLGYLLLRGRCRGCGLPISARYPLVEAGVGLLLAGFYLAEVVAGSGNPLDADLAAAWRLADGLALLGFLVTGTLIAYDTGAVPAAITTPGVIVGLVLGALRPGVTGMVGLGAGLAGLAIGGALVLAARRIGPRVRAGASSVAGRGPCDGAAAFAAMIGAFVGGRSIVVVLAVAAAAVVLGAGVGRRRRDFLRIRLEPDV